MADSRRWSFGAVAFDERAMQLFIGGRAVEQELKPLEVLRYLLQRPRQAISKDDLVKAVWPGRISEIETIGDAFLVEFSGALAAVECAVAIQRRFAEYNAVAPPPVPETARRRVPEK